MSKLLEFSKTDFFPKMCFHKDPEKQPCVSPGGGFLGSQLGFTLRLQTHAPLHSGRATLSLTVIYCSFLISKTEAFISNFML